MSTTSERVAGATEPTALRWRGRVPLALLLPVGPAAVAVLRFVLPYDTVDSGPDVARQVAAHPTAENAVVWLGFVAMLSLVPAVIVVGKVARRDAPRLAALGVMLAVPGYLVLGWLVASDAAVLFAVDQGLSLDVAGRAYTDLHPVMLVAGGIFVLGHVVGTILLGCALLCGTAIARWAAVLVILAQPVHFVAAVVVSSHGLDLVGWGMNAAGFAAVAVAVLRMSDEEWSTR